MIGVSRHWPPLIMAAHTPRWVKVRDVLLTLAMWILFAIMLETEFELFFGHYLKEIGLGDFFHTEPNWSVFFERLRPYLVTTAVLTGLLTLASVRTLRRHRRSLLLPQPSPLPAAVQARHAGITEAALLAARDLPIAVAHIDNDGEYRIEAFAPSTERGADCKSVNS
jgi:hypothetical protein